MARVGLVGRVAVFGIAVLALALMPAHAQTQPTVAWAIFIDDLHADFRNTGRLRQLLRGVGDELIQAGDTYAVTTSGPSGVTISFNSDPAVFVAAIKKVSGSALRPADALGSPNQGDVSSEVHYRAEVAIATARRSMADLVALRRDTAPTKAFISISSGYHVDLSERTVAPSTSRPPARPPRDRRLGQTSSLAKLRSEWATLAATATQGGVKIFAIDPRLVDTDPPDALIEPQAWLRYLTATQQSLALLCQQSGGFALQDRTELASGLTRINRLLRTAF